MWTLVICVFLSGEYTRVAKIIGPYADLYAEQQSLEITYGQIVDTQLWPPPAKELLCLQTN